MEGEEQPDDETNSTEYRIEAVWKRDGETFRLYDDEEIIDSNVTDEGIEIWYLTPAGDGDE